MRDAPRPGVRVAEQPREKWRPKWKAPIAAECEPTLQDLHGFAELAPDDVQMSERPACDCKAPRMIRRVGYADRLLPVRDHFVELSSFRKAPTQPGMGLRGRQSRSAEAVSAAGTVKQVNYLRKTVLCRVKVSQRVPIHSDAKARQNAERKLVRVFRETTSTVAEGTSPRRVTRQP